MMNVNVSNDSVVRRERDTEEQVSVVQQLADAHSEIDQLKLKLAWMERSYE
ncbi:MAG: hypothetical protein ACPGTQ_08980 [Colwellia sp.]